MPKLRGPLLSLEARGGLAKLFSLVRRRGQHIIERKPIPVDAKSPAQLFYRHMFTKCTALWHLLSEAEKAEWERLATPRHMTGYAWFISQCLRPNPGIYLPLQGGTMSGDINMDGHSLLNLPDVTRELFIPAGAGHSSGSLDAVGYWTAWTLTDNVTRTVTMNIKVPDDFVSLISVKVLWNAPPATGNMYWRLAANYAAAGEPYATHSDIAAYGATPTGGAYIFNLQEPADPLTLAGLQKGDFLGIQFTRDGGHANDTLNALARFFGLLFTYVAEPRLSG